jgi:adenylate cyclase
MSLPSSTEAWLESSSGTVVPLKGNCSFGRSSENQVVIASERVSRRHAIIHAQDGGEFWLADLGSSNGTFVNERRLVRPTLLRSGDVIGIGQERLTFHSPSAPPESDDESGVSQMTVVDVRTEPCWLLVADIEDFTGLSQRVTPDALAALVGRWIRLCKEQIEGQDGTINKYLGDGFIAFWHGADSAEKVAKAMNGLLQARKTSELKYRVILHFGPVALGGAASMGEESLMGPEVNYVFRMEKVASAQKVAFCLSDAAEPLLAGLLPIVPMAGEHELKGFSGHHRFFALEI